jgi:hypothetical protein
MRAYSNSAFIMDMMHGYMIFFKEICYWTVWHFFPQGQKEEERHAASGAAKGCGESGKPL